MEMQLNTDRDGYISQECPECENRFKIRFGEGSEQPIGHCPYCGHRGQDCWWTKTQADYIGSYVREEIVAPELEKMAKDFNRTANRSGNILNMKMDVKSSPSSPMPTEANEDWPTTTFECCGEKIKHEPGKIRLHCVICGKETADN